MQLGELAEQVLLSPSLELKLNCPAVVVDEEPGTLRRVPDQPARPPHLRFSQSRNRAPFPGLHQLEDESMRGQLLHFFANHELLATELMALVLLKFPDAPKPFRQGVFQTLKEEQAHTRWYLQRLEQLGVPFGQFPVSGYFWKAIASMENPMDYVSRLSLTFEQANLDHAAFFAAQFKTVGDLQSARLLERIHRDEIGHVGFGLQWFRRWKEPGLDDWEAFERILKYPLSASRAKGAAFNAQARRRAGLDSKFIDELFVYSKSKGRTPAVFLFNPLAESFMGQSSGYKPKRALLALEQDLANLPQFLARTDDVVLVPRQPRTDFLRGLKEAGVDLPQFEELVDGTLALDSELRARKIGALRPWAWCGQSLELLRPLISNLPPNAQPWPAGWEERLPLLYAKTWSADLLRQFLAQRPDRDWLCPEQDAGRSVATEKEALDLIDAIRKRGHPRVVAKTPFGLTGQNMLRLWEPHLLESQRAWIQRRLARHGALVIEPWLDRVLDFSIQLDLGPEGLRLLGLVKMDTDQRGQYIGSICHPKFVMGLDCELATFYRGQSGSDLMSLCTDLMRFLEPKLQAAQFRGALGIDAMIYRDMAGRLRLKPIVEINARYTMGRLALELMRYAATGCSARLELVGKTALAKTGLATFHDLVEALARRYPLRREGRPKPRIAAGVLCLNDPRHARQVLALWRVGKGSEMHRPILASSL